MFGQIIPAILYICNTHHYPTNKKYYDININDLSFSILTNFHYYAFKSTIRCKMKNFDLLTTVTQGGCSAKIPPQQLEIILKHLDCPSHPNLLVGTDTSDDACVWKLNDSQAIIQTTDFFPPICSDGYEFGQIAAANSLSDVYAMGGDPITALNLVMFPRKELDLIILQDILRGGADKIKEAGAVIGGGHSIDDKTIKYGLAVTGTVHPDRIITNNNAQIGDKLILTKPIGTGIIIEGKKLNKADNSHYQNALDSMKRLNNSAAKIMQEFNVNAATDITGFGLMGHSFEMAKGSNVSIDLFPQEVPLLEGAYEIATRIKRPCALARNIEYVQDKIDFGNTLDETQKMIMFDAQTSGGILMSVAETDAKIVLKNLQNEGLSHASIVGEVIPFNNKQINLR